MYSTYSTYIHAHVQDDVCVFGAQAMTWIDHAEKLEILTSSKWNTYIIQIMKSNLLYWMKTKLFRIASRSNSYFEKDKCILELNIRMYLGVFESIS